MEFQQQARVSFAAQERYRILIDSAEIDAVPAGTLRWDGTLPAVGDWVDVRMAGDELAVIENVLSRTTVISRRHVGRAHDEQILAANVDLIVVVMALDRDFNVRRLERYLVLAAESGAGVLIALNKAELCDDPAARLAEIELVAPGVPCVILSAIESVAALLPYIGGGAVVLLGSSGVGKSTIVNALLGEGRQAAREVRESDCRGKHTTTHRMLLPLPGGGALIDTPGLRELSLWASQPALDEAFSDIAALAAGCRFRDCSHADEPGCAVVGAVDPTRWASYLKLQGEIRHHSEKKRWKTIHKAMRHHPKYQR
jgi:ribosome biogenesis GTPase